LAQDYLFKTFGIYIKRENTKNPLIIERR